MSIKTPPASDLYADLLKGYLDPADGSLDIDVDVEQQLHRAGLISGRPGFRYRWAEWDDSWHDPVAMGGQALSVAQVCFTWMQSISPNRRSDIWLVGGTGMGKDHLGTVMAVALAVRWSWRARRCDWLTTTEELKPNNGTDTSLTPYKTCEVLIVSDPDLPDATFFRNKKLAELVRARLDRDLITIWTSNTPLATFCQRIRTSSRRDERVNFNGVGQMMATRMRESAAVIESRLRGRVEFEVPFSSPKGDWRRAHGYTKLHALRQAA